MFRSEGNFIEFEECISDAVDPRPDWCVALVRLAAHHAMSSPSTPFGAPLVTPPLLKDQAVELAQQVVSIHLKYPEYSIADIWAFLCCRALRRLGGPALTNYVGRGHHTDQMQPEALIAVTPSVLQDDRKDVLKIKRHLVQSGFGTDEITALLALVRGLGYHSSSGMRGALQLSDEQRAQRVSDPGFVGVAGVDELYLYESDRKCTTEPYIFGTQYFVNLLSYNWKKENRRGTLYRCREEDRRSLNIYINQFSSENFEELIRRSGRVPMTEEEAAVAEDKLKGKIDAIRALGPCGRVSMEPIDLSLLDDGLIQGWMHRFIADEPRLFAVVSSAMDRILKSGYNLNNLRPAG
jgi:hypothetical protein